MICPGCGAPDDQGCFFGCPEVMQSIPQEDQQAIIDKYAAQATRLISQGGDTFLTIEVAIKKALQDLEGKLMLLALKRKVKA